MLVRLLYASRIVDQSNNSNHETINAIMQHARLNNPEFGVTGVLCYHDATLVQILEGSRSAVNQLYNVILHDERHTDVMLLDYAEIEERRYAGWAMGLCNLGKLNPSVLLKYSSMPDFQPHRMSGRTLLKLIDELAATAAIVGRP